MDRRITFPEGVGFNNSLIFVNLRSTLSPLEIYFSIPFIHLLSSFNFAIMRLQDSSTLFVFEVRPLKGPVSWRKEAIRCTASSWGLVDG